MNEEKKPEIGDVVYLNSGGPPMTVTIVAEETVQCSWVGDPCIPPMRAEFKIACVTKVNPRHLQQEGK